MKQKLENFINFHLFLRSFICRQKIPSAESELQNFWIVLQDYSMQNKVLLLINESKKDVHVRENSIKIRFSRNKKNIINWKFKYTESQDLNGLVLTITTTYSSWLLIYYDFMKNIAIGNKITTNCTSLELLTSCHPFV